VRLGAIFLIVFKMMAGRRMGLLQFTAKTDWREPEQRRSMSVQT
jgi:hypothetical protein